MSYRDPGINLPGIVALAVSIVIFVIVISLVTVTLSALDFTGHLRRTIPLIVFMIALLILLVIFVIVMKYAPDLITRE